LENLFTPNKVSYKKVIVIGLLTILAVSFLFSSVTVLGANSAVGDQDWAMFRHDLSHSGASPSTGPNTNNTLWQYYLQSTTVSSSPSVVNGKVYIGSNDGIYCLNFTTGELLWKHVTQCRVQSSPAIVDGKVYIGTTYSYWFDGNENGRDYGVYCLDANTGVKIWNYTKINVQSSPVVIDDKVLIYSSNGNLLCLDAIAGTKIWSYFTAGINDSTTVESSPAVANGKVYIGSENKNVYCLDYITGEFLWKFTTGGEIESSPAVADGKVYIGSNDGKVYCLDASAGTQTWNYSRGGAATYHSSPSVVDGKVYIGGGTGGIICLNAATGAKIWSFAAHGSSGSSPAVADGKVYIGSYEGNIYCLDASAGTQTWNYSTGYYSGIDSSPAVVDGKVYIGSGNKLYCFGSPVSYPQRGPESWAIIIGVSDYKYLGNLTYCDDDANSIYNQLASRWGTDHIRLLTNTNATKLAIFNTLNTWLSFHEDSNDTVLFFFSGHGGPGTDIVPMIPQVQQQVLYATMN
jgi:outer membrane protein assembly factor BamB